MSTTLLQASLNPASYQMFSQQFLKKKKTHETF